MGDQDERAAFIKVGVKDVEIGKPLSHPLYDSNRKLLLKRGYVIETQHQCEMLIERGLYRNLNERAAVASTAPRAGEDLPPPREAITTLDATKIRIGDPIQMQSSADAPRLVARLIGYAKNRGLIVTVPETDGDLVMLKEGQSFIVRFFSGQNAYAFTTVVAKQTNVPFPHLHLSYPREVRGLEIRKGSRIDVDIIAAIVMDPEGVANQGAGKIFNLSVGGAALRSAAPLGKKGDVVNVKFKVEIHEIQSFIVFDSVIRTITEEKNVPGMPHVYGIQFINPDEAMVLALAAYVYQRIVDDAR